MRSEIEKYINGELNGDELRAFEEAMRSDPELKKEVELQKRIVEDLGAIRISGKIKRIQKQHARFHQIRKWTIIAIGLTLIASILLINRFRADRDPDLDPTDQIREDSIADPQNVTTDSNGLNPGNPDHDSLKSPKDQRNKEAKRKPDAEQSEAVKKQEIAVRPSDDKSMTEPYPIIISSDEYMKTIALREYTVPDDLAFLRSAGPMNTLDSVKYLFNEAQYEAGLRALARSGLPEAERKFMAAHFLFKKGLFKQSIELLNQIPAREVTELRRAQIDWQLYLCYLALGKSQLQNSETIYHRVKMQAGHLYKKRIEKIRSEIISPGH